MSSSFVVGFYEYNDNQWKLNDKVTSITIDEYTDIKNATITVNGKTYPARSLAYETATGVRPVFKDTLEYSVTVYDGTKFQNKKPFLFTVSFDEHSSSSFKYFVEQIRKIIETQAVTTYYKSMNIKYIGHVTYDPQDNHQIRNGYGKEYHDKPGQYVKYEGEFEEDTYSGGEFISDDGKIVVIANNICNGIPTRMITITYDDGNSQTVKYDEIDGTNNLSCSDVDFCEQIAEEVYDDISSIRFVHDTKTAFESVGISAIIQAMNELRLENESLRDAIETELTKKTKKVFGLF